jgi:hypothetical protein
MNAHEYYAQPAIRKRIIEFLGGTSLETATCIFIAHGAVGSSRRIYPQPAHELYALLDRESDIARSLWDSRSLLMHLDIEYVNFDSVVEPYCDPQRTFNLQIPVINAIKRILSSFGIAPLQLLSGRGYHLVWRILRSSPAFERLCEQGRLPPGVESYYGRNPPLPGKTVPAEYARAFAGLGMIMEFLTDAVIHEASPLCAIPVTITDVEVEPQQRGRETISIDVSEYSDPLSTRMIRIPFSIYTKTVGLKNRKTPLQHLFFIPLNGMTISNAIAVTQSPDEICLLAENTSVAIPEFSGESLQLISGYADSALARFHEYYYAVPQCAPPEWPMNYETADFFDLPPCIKNLLTRPDKKLLRPAALQLVVRALYASGWHPQHIAGLIRSKYESDYDWGEEWQFYNAATRSDFYARALAGAIATGVDRLDDFNCRSIKRKGYCPEHCNNNAFEKLRAAALQRRFP